MHSYAVVHVHDVTLNYEFKILQNFGRLGFRKNLVLRNYYCDELNAQCLQLHCEFPVGHVCMPVGQVCMPVGHVCMPVG